MTYDHPLTRKLTVYYIENGQILVALFTLTQPMQRRGAQTQQDIPILGTTHADHLTCDIPCAPGHGRQDD